MKKLIILLFIFLILLVPSVLAVSVPNLGQSSNFGILSSTYTNTVSGTTINGDLGYTTPPAVNPTVNGTTNIANSTQAGIDQGSALASLNSQPCDFTFGSATDLSLLPQPLTAGVYCITGAVSVGTAGITLSNDGTYLFRIDGALNTVANSVITGSACNVFWTPTEATTLGANSTFLGTDIDDSGITIGSNVTWSGRALSYSGTVSTDTDTITVPQCGQPTPTVIQTSTPSSNGGSGVSDNQTGSLGCQHPSDNCNTMVGKFVSPKLPNTGFAPRLDK